jgi:hypothetical protein
MKTILLFIPLLGFALPATAAEPAKTNSSPATTDAPAEKQSATPTAPAGAVTMADEQMFQKVGERIALSGEIRKAPPSKARTIGGLFNPFAPVEPKSETRWLERTAWSTAAAMAAGSATPVEVRHEPHFGVILASQ